MTPEQNASSMEISNHSQQRCVSQSCQQIEELQFEILKYLEDDKFKLLKDPDYPTNYPGKIFYYAGRRFKIVNTQAEGQSQQQQNKDESPKIQCVIFQNDQQTIYLVQSSKRQVQIQSKGKIIKTNAVEYLKEWIGYLVVRGKLISYGCFHYFDRFSKGTELSIEHIQNEDHPLGDLYPKMYMLRFYKGDFFYNNKHSQEAQQQYLEYNNSQRKFRVVCKIEGSFVKNVRIGKHYIKILHESPQNPQTYHCLFNYAGCIVTSQETQHKKKSYLDNPSIILRRMNMSIDYKFIKCLEPTQWLSQDIVNYFFQRLHLCYISLRQANKRINILPLSTEFFSDLVNSCHFRNKKVSLNWENSKIFIHYNVFEETVCLLELYHLILIPIHRDGDHFSLGAIVTNIQRDLSTDQIVKVRITIFDLDSLHNDGAATHRISQFLNKIIAQISNSQTRTLYEQAMIFAQSQVRTRQFLKATQQENSVDCGVYTCIYGFLLYEQECYGTEVCWTFSQNVISLLREYIRENIYWESRDFYREIKRMILGQKTKM